MSPPIQPEPDPRRARFIALRQAQPNASRESIIAQVEREFAAPQTPTAGSQIQAPAEATGVALRTMAPNSPPGLSAEDVNAPRIPLPRSPGAITTGLLHAGNTLIPFADEAAAALTTGDVSGPEYETARRLAEYRIGSSANAHPTAAGLGTGIGAAGLASILPVASPEVLAGRGTGRFLGRAVAEGTGLGALYSAGASDPGDRLASAIRGGAQGAIASGILGGLGAASGAVRGTKAGRAALNVAEAGDADIGAAQARLREAHPDSPLMAADLLGPIGPSRIRAASAVPGPGQRLTAEAFPARTAGRPERFQQVLETELGTGGVNPYRAADELLTTRQREAETLFTNALEPQGKPVVLPQDQTAPLLKIPRIRQLVDEYRAINNTGVPDRSAQRGVLRNAPGLEKVTGPELQYVKRRLAELGEGAEPGGSAQTQAVGRRANSIQGAVENVLNNVPGYREANQRYAERSGLMEARELGDRLLQTDPAKVEYQMGQMSPDQVRMMRLGIPTSTSRAIESGSAQSAMGKLGIGPGGRLGRARTMEAVLPEQAAKRFSQVAADEQLMIPAERAQNITSPTEPTRQSVGEAALGGLSFGEAGAVRRLLLRSLHGGPNPSALAEDARMLTTGGSNRAALERLLNEAVGARQGRGQNRLLGLGIGRGVSAGVPTADRTNVMQDRATNTDVQQQVLDYFDDLRAAGVTEERARDLTARRFGF